MDIRFLLNGVLIGLSIAAPVGPIGVLCIRRTLNQGRLAGLVTGLGAAAADAVYGTVAGFGLSMVSALLIEHQLWLRLVGGAFLCYLGVKTFLAAPEERTPSAGKSSLVGAFTSTFVLTITNPMTILSFAAIMAGLGVTTAAGGHLAATTLVLGVFAGSALWWLTLSGGVGLLRSRFNLRRMRWLNRVSGVVIVAFGIAALASARG
jgi:threonine/homoserine/homoserine lactone efflux protein